MLFTRFSTLTFLFGFAACGQVLAQENDASIDDIDTIVVTASLSPLAQVNVGSSVTVIDRDQIQRRQSRYVTDLLRTVPGFSVSHSGTTGSQTQVRVRGAEANHVLVLIDGIRANDPSGSDEFRWEHLSTNNVERIEIVRGPQSSLWGSEAVAAVVHIITRSGSHQPEFGGYAEGGSNSTLNAGLQGGAGGENWAINYGAERLDTEGTNISRSGDEEDNSDLTTLSLSGRFQYSGNLSFTAGVRVVDAYSQFDPVDFFVTGLPTDGDVATDSGQSYYRAGATFLTLDGRLTHQLNARYLETSNKNLVDGTETSSTASDRSTIAYQADLQMNENTLSMAVEHERSRFVQRGEIGFGDPNQNQESTVSSFVADFQARPNRRLTWLLSGRYDNYDNFDDAVTGRLSMAFQAGDATLLRANVGTGQKTPTFTERFGFFPGQFIGNPDLKPEKSTAFDIGVEQTFMDFGLDVQLTLFHQDLEDEINGFVFDPITFLFTAENKTGSSTRKGVELAASLDATEFLEFGATYTYTDSTETDDLGGNQRELRRPRHAGSVTIDYRFVNERANLFLVADYGGSRNDIFFPPFPEPSEIVTTGSFWQVGLTAAYDILPNLNLFARVDNLLDEDYEQVFGYRTPGRAAYIGFRVNFTR